MTEAQWLACEDPREMIDHLQATASGRKLYLLAASCWQQWSHMLYDETSRNGITALEAIADGRAVDDSRLCNAEGRFVISCKGKSRTPVGLLIEKTLGTAITSRGIQWKS